MVQPIDQASDARRQLTSNRASRREAHKQRLTRADARRPEKFDHAQFIAYVDPMSMKFDKFGTLSIALKVPPEFRDHAMSLINAHGVLLSVDLQRWNEVPVDDDDD